MDSPFFKYQICLKMLQLLRHWTLKKHTLNRIIHEILLRISSACKNSIYFSRSSSSDAYLVSNLCFAKHCGFDDPIDRLLNDVCVWAWVTHFCAPTKKKRNNKFIFIIRSVRNAFRFIESASTLNCKKRKTLCIGNFI